MLDRWCSLRHAKAATLCCRAVRVWALACCAVAAKEEGAADYVGRGCNVGSDVPSLALPSLPSDGAACGAQLSAPGNTCLSMLPLKPTCAARTHQEQLALTWLERWEPSDQEPSRLFPVPLEPCAQSHHVLEQHEIGMHHTENLTKLIVSVPRSHSATEATKEDTCQDNSLVQRDVQDACVLEEHTWREPQPMRQEATPLHIQRMPLHCLEHANAFPVHRAARLHIHRLSVGLEHKQKNAVHAAADELSEACHAPEEPRSVVPEAHVSHHQASLSPLNQVGEEASCFQSHGVRVQDMPNPHYMPHLAQHQSGWASCITPTAPCAEAHTSGMAKTDGKCRLGLACGEGTHIPNLHIPNLSHHTPNLSHHTPDLSERTAGTPCSLASKASTVERQRNAHNDGDGELDHHDGDDGLLLDDLAHLMHQCAQNLARASRQPPASAAWPVCAGTLDYIEASQTLTTPTPKLHTSSVVEARTHNCQVTQQDAAEREQDSAVCQTPAPLSAPESREGMEKTRQKTQTSRIASVDLHRILCQQHAPSVDTHGKDRQGFTGEDRKCLMLTQESQLACYAARYPPTLLLDDFLRLPASDPFLLKPLILKNLPQSSCLRTAHTPDRRAGAAHDDVSVHPDVMFPCPHATHDSLLLGAFEEAAAHETRQWPSSVVVADGAAALACICRVAPALVRSSEGGCMASGSEEGRAREGISRNGLLAFEGVSPVLVQHYITNPFLINGYVF